MSTQTSEEDLDKATHDLLALLVRKGRALGRSKDSIAEAQEKKRIASLAAAARFAARFEWKATHSVALLEETSCAHCGSHQQVFKGFGLRMVREADQVERYLMTGIDDPGLPKDRHFLYSQLPACAECLPEQGY